MSDEWLCACLNEDHGHLGCVRSVDEKGDLCRLCQDDVHDED